jgi:hypothetical protein
MSHIPEETKFMRTRTRFSVRVSVWILAAILLVTASVRSAEMNNANGAAILNERLAGQFQRLLADPVEYQRLVRTECSDFPEGDLFPFTLPALAYAHLAIAHPDRKPEFLSEAEKLITMCLPIVARRTRAPDGDLRLLENYTDHAVHLGQLNLALGRYKQAGGMDSPLLETHEAISHVLLSAAEAAQGKPLKSYPHLTWSFDTMPVLLSLKLSGVDAQRVDRVIGAHLDWIKTKGTDHRYQLPYSAGPTTLPRGCELSLRIPILAELDKEFAIFTYNAYKKHFWIDRGNIAGFAEWPGGTGNHQDMDSGPIVDGIGMSATGNSFAAARALGDSATFKRLLDQLALRDIMVAAAIFDPAAKGFLDSSLDSLGIKFNPAYYTGFLYGDAALFAVLTWPPIAGQ